MAKNRTEEFNQIVKTIKATYEDLVDYWIDYSLYASFEYWMELALFILPLIFLFFKIDKTKIFQIGFYGYSVHMIAHYIDIFVREMGFRNHPIPLIPFLPGFAFDSSLIPVTFMLVYQWTLNNKKNYYLFSGIAALLFSFVLNPTFVSINLLRLYGKTNYFHVFLGYVIVIIGAKFINDVFLWTERKFKKPSN
ncbi:hypothetical protein [Neobacillus mesonae]|uniref:hypothetical protein n=1 Tax=Neobacillus mesonae TaxID=1193713 RepID=UPI00203FB6B4|nr:hypothetical protein [Neobacillus mesonae]MCM3570626.1 hypothetical protein [Neobacillus mesonae]